MFVLAAATPAKWGDPILSDESLEQFETNQLEKGDVVGIGLHTGNALVGYELGQRARAQGAWVVYGGSHPTLFPKRRTSGAVRMPWSRVTAMSLGAGLSRIVQRHTEADLRRRAS